MDPLEDDAEWRHDSSAAAAGLIGDELPLSMPLPLCSASPPLDFGGGSGNNHLSLAAPFGLLSDPSQQYRSLQLRSCDTVPFGPNDSQPIRCTRCFQRLEEMKSCRLRGAQEGSKLWAKNWDDSGTACFGACDCSDFCVTHGFPMSVCTAAASAAAATAAVGAPAIHESLHYHGSWIVSAFGFGFGFGTDGSDFPNALTRSQPQSTAATTKAVAAAAPTMTPDGPASKKRALSESAFVLSPPPAAANSSPISPSLSPASFTAPLLPTPTSCGCEDRIRRLIAVKWVSRGDGGHDRLMKYLGALSTEGCQGFCRTPYCCRIHWCPADVFKDGSATKFHCRLGLHDNSQNKGRHHADYAFYCADPKCCGGRWFSRDETHKRATTKRLATGPAAQTHSPSFTGAGASGKTALLSPVAVESKATDFLLEARRSDGGVYAPQATQPVPSAPPIGMATEASSGDSWSISEDDSEYSAVEDSAADDGRGRRRNERRRPTSDSDSNAYSRERDRSRSHQHNKRHSRSSSRSRSPPRPSKRDRARDKNGDRDRDRDRDEERQLLRNTNQSSSKRSIAVAVLSAALAATIVALMAVTVFLVLLRHQPFKPTTDGVQLCAVLSWGSNTTKTASFELCTPCSIEKDRLSCLILRSPDQLNVTGRVLWADARKKYLVSDLQAQTTFSAAAFLGEYRLPHGISGKSSKPTPSGWHDTWFAYLIG